MAGARLFMAHAAPDAEHLAVEQARLTEAGWRALATSSNLEETTPQSRAADAPVHGLSDSESDGGDGSSWISEPSIAHGNSERNCFTDFLSRHVYSWRYFLVIFWPIVAGISCVYAPKLFQVVVPLDKEPPAGTDSSVALEAFRAHFPNLMGVMREMVVIRCAEKCDSPVNVLSKGFVEEIQDVVKHFGELYPGTIIHMHSYYTYGENIHPNPMLSHDGQSMLFQWSWHIPNHLKIKAEQLCARVLSIVSDINTFQVNSGPGALRVSATGPTFIDYSMRDVLVNELPVHEFSVLPISLGILAWQLKSIKMLIFPLIALAIAAPIAYAAVYFIALHVTVTSHAPMMMILLCSALSLDYSLFLLTRYNEERMHGSSVERSVQEMVAGSGPVVVLSGVVLLVSYVAMLFLPSIARTFAVGAGGMIVSCVLVQLTFVPALMACCPALGVQGPSAKEENSDPEEAAAKDAREITDTDPMGRAALHMDSCWFKMGSFLTRFPVNILVPLLIYAAMMPLTLRLLRFKPGHGFELAVPRHGNEWATALEVQRDFSGDVGAFFPILLLAMEDHSTSSTPRKLQGSTKEQQFFDDNCYMVETLINATKGSSHALTADDFRSPTFYGKSASGGVQCLSYWETHLFRKNVITQHLITSKLLQQLWDELVSDKHDAMLTILYPKMDAFSQPAFDLVHDLRITLAEDSKKVGGLKFFTFSGTGVEMDMIKVTSVTLPIAFGCCALVSFAVIACSFNAALIPIKLFFTVAFPISWSYGAALYVYQDGIFDWTGREQLMPVHSQGLSWLAPMFTLTLTLGLALDYDVFYFARIMEYRREGFGDRESIVLALAATGPIIAAAGLIFAVTFSSLLLASIPLINHMGFLMSFTVLVDTYVVRTVLVPAMLSLSPSLNYWPSRMPKAKYTWY